MEKTVNNYLNKVQTRVYKRVSKPQPISTQLPEVSAQIQGETIHTIPSRQKVVNIPRKVFKILIHKDNVVATSASSILISNGYTSIWIAKKQAFADLYTNLVSIYINEEWEYSTEDGQKVSGLEIKSLNWD